MKLPDPPNPILYRPEEPIGLIQGQQPMSVNEWFVSQALDKLELYYFYQFTIDGGTGLRGGQVIDFLVQTGGWVPLYVNGSWWHSQRNDPELPLRLAAARARFNRDPVIIEEEESNTRQAALAAVRKKLL